MSEHLSDGVKDRMRRIVNDFKRQELAEKYGLAFPPNVDFDLSPEAESEWLDSLEAFEAQHKDAARISVRAFVGDPAVRPVHDVPPQQIEAELTWLLDVLADHHVIIDFLYEIEMAEAYRFLVEELLDEEMDDIRIPDMVHHFVYEEFHPNDREDARVWAEEFLNAFIMRDQQKLEAILGDPALRDGQGRSMTPDNLTQAMQSFHASYGIPRRFTLKTEVRDIQDDQAIVKAHLTWYAMTRDEDEPLTAKITVWLTRNPIGGWDVAQADLPPCPPHLCDE